MTRNGAAAGNGLRLCVCGAAVVAFLMAFLSISGSAFASVGDGLTGSRCFLDAAPDESTPPSSEPTLALVDETETSIDEDLETEDDSEYSWPVAGAPRTPSTRLGVRASRADRGDTPRFFVDAADLSRFCKLTI